jgi:hypothetical protein
VGLHLHLGFQRVLVDDYRIWFWYYLLLFHCLSESRFSSLRENINKSCLLSWFDLIYQQEILMFVDRNCLDFSSWPNEYEVDSFLKWINGLDPVSIIHLFVHSLFTYFISFSMIFEILVNLVLHSLKQCSVILF